MTPTELLTDAFTRIPRLVHASVEGLEPSQLRERLDPDANPVGWLVWHLTRVEDHHVSEIAGRPQAWVAEGWAERFGRPADPSDVGYGHTSEQVAGFDPIGADLLVEYHDRVAARTFEWLRDDDGADLDRVIDVRWDPPVTVGVRLVSVIGDCLQHVGQAAFVRGILLRRE